MSIKTKLTSRKSKNKFWVTLISS